MLLDSGFDATQPSKPFFCGLIVEEKTATGVDAIAFATFCNAYSTWEGKVFYLTDIFVRAKHRGRGVGKQIFFELFRIAKRTNCHRFDFHANIKNNAAREFYRKFGVINLTEAEEWQLYNWEAVE